LLTPFNSQPFFIFIRTFPYWNTILSFTCLNFIYPINLSSFLSHYQIITVIIIIIIPITHFVHQYVKVNFYPNWVELLLNLIHLLHLHFPFLVYLFRSPISLVILYTIYLLNLNPPLIINILLKDVGVSLLQHVIYLKELLAHSKI